MAIKINLKHPSLQQKLVWDTV